MPLSEAKQAEVVDFLKSRDWVPVDESNERSQDMEHLLRRALHLILCTPEYQIH